MRFCLQNILAAALLALMSMPIAVARAGDPAVPPGLDPGGVAIALFTTGIDYTDPKVAARLARDGEGQLIGWDFVDNDITPFASDPVATDLAKLLLQTNQRARLVVVRVDPEAPLQLARAAAFAGRTPARIAAVPFDSLSEQTWELFVQVAAKATRMLFVLPAGNVEHIVEGTPIWPAAAGLPNAIRAAPLVPFIAMIKKGGASFAQVDAGVDAWVFPGGSHTELLSGRTFAPPRTGGEAVVVVAALAGCLSGHGPVGRTGTDLRSALMARNRRPNDPDFKGAKIHNPFCRN